MKFLSKKLKRALDAAGCLDAQGNYAPHLAKEFDRLTLWYDVDTDRNGDRYWTGVTVAIIALNDNRFIGISRGKFTDPIGRSMTKHQGREMALSRALAAYHKFVGAKDRPFLDSNLSYAETIENMRLDSIKTNYGRMYYIVDEHTGKAVTAIPESQYEEPIKREETKVVV